MKSILKTGKESSVVIFITSVLLMSLILSCSDDPVNYPVLVTLPVQDSDITSATAKLKAEITDIGNQKIIEYGIEIYKKTLLVPVEAKGYKTAPVIGTFEVDFTGLEANTLYYYRAYSLINTAYYYSENNMQFTTKTK